MGALSTGSGILDRQECLRLLAGGTVGRLFYTENALPAIHPGHYLLDEDTILTRTPTGTILTAGGPHIAAFQVDHLDHTTHTGWSVVVIGHAHLADYRPRPGSLPSWIIPEHASQLLSIKCTLISGRAFAPSDKQIPLRETNLHTNPHRIPTSHAD